MKVIITESQTTTWNLKIPRKKLTAIPSALRGFLLRSSLHDQKNNTKTNILVNYTNSAYKTDSCHC